MRRLGILLLAAALVRLGGCYGQELAAPAPSSTPTHLHKFEAACGVLGDPESFFDAYEQSFVAGDLSAMRRLYARDFVFYADTLWCGTCGGTFPWDREEELQGLQNMFDPDWMPLPVVERRFSYFIRSVADSGTYLEVDADLEFTCLGDWGGAIGSSRFSALLRQTQCGDLQLMELREHYLGLEARVPGCYSEFRCWFYLGLAN